MPTTTKTEIIWNEIVSILKSAKDTRGGKLAYVKEILEGVREDVPLFPCIILEPISETELEYSIPLYKRINLQLSITCWIESYGVTKQITGETGTDKKGIFDIVADVKNVINEYPDLNGKALKINFASTIYVFETYPNRAGAITMNIEFITQKTER